MLWIEVLHQEEGHAGLLRQVRQQVAEGFQPSRRGANADDGEGTVPQPLIRRVRGGLRRRAHRIGFWGGIGRHGHTPTTWYSYTPGKPLSSSAAPAVPSAGGRPSATS